MARITTGPIIADIRGKSGDQIFSRNKYGPYVKAFAVPTGTPSEAMETARDRMAAVVAAWHGLTEVNRQRWYAQANALNSKAKRTPREVLTGYNLFTRCQMHRLTMGLAQNTVPSAIISIPTTLFEIDYEDTTGTEGYITWQRGTSDWRIMMYGSPQFPLSRYSVNVTPYKYIGNIPWGGNNEPLYNSFTLDYFEVYDIEAFTANRTVFYKCLPVNINNGQVAPAIYLRALTS